MRIKYHLFIALFSFFCLGVTSVHATDGKTLPGSTCQPQNQNLPFRISSITGGIFNPSTITQRYVCPVLRDLMSADNDGIDDFIVKVRDRHATRPVRCILRSMRSNGTQIAAAIRSSIGASNFIKTLNFPALARSKNGYYLLSCTVPGRTALGQSGVVMYKVDEES